MKVGRLRQTLIAASLVVAKFLLVESFWIKQLQNNVRSSTISKKKSLYMSSSMIEFEYIPPNRSGSQDFKTTLPSVYPPGTPAGMRGEAVRAALRSSQCLGWKLASSAQSARESPNLASGLLKLQGRGVLNFLNNKLSNSFRAGGSNFANACLLTSKGRLVDTLAIGYSDTESFVMPSPGHSGLELFQKLDPFIFPMDEVKLTDLSESSTIFTLASTNLEHVENAFRNHLLPTLKKILPSTTAALDALVLPTKKQHVVLHWSLTEASEDSRLLILPLTGLPECAAVGYTFAFCGHAQGPGNEVWQHLIGDENAKGPVEIKALEYETLRIEAGQPAFGFEVTGAWKEPEIISPTPLELHIKAGVIDFEKGCYLGQEGIASVVKNPRGPPRSLYSVTFEDDDNIYLHQPEGDNSSTENLTKIPRVGDNLYVLGSNEQIQVGVLTSVAEPSGTGDMTIIGLALIRRADSVLKQMKSMDLQIPRGMANTLASSSNFMDIADTSQSGIIPPPPMDSLDGLEVIVGGTFTVGMLRSVPSRKLPCGKNMYVDQEQVFLTREEILDQGYVDIEYSGMTPSEFLDAKAAEFTSVTETKLEATDIEGKMQVEESKSNAAESKDDETEAKRKAEKMELLKKRAEDAIARRKMKKMEAESEKVESTIEVGSSLDGDEESEAKRKAAKLQMLQKRAEEAIARRRQKKEEQD